MASGFGNEKKKSNSDILIYVAAAAAVMLLCTWGGYVLEMTASPKKGVQLMKAMEAMPEYITPTAIVNAFVTVFTGSLGIAKNGLVIGLIGGGLIVLYRLSVTGKRYHRKGSEHGSARWGNKREKDIIADTNDFYNNAIAASDVFLVLDRKIRDENAAAAEKKKKKSETKHKGKKQGETSAKSDGKFVQPPHRSEEEQGADIDGEKFINEKLSLKKIAEMKKEAAKIKPMLNLNMIILGGSGTGKSRFYVKPNIMQCNASFVVTDPSGELLQSCGKMLERRGYKIKVFNINDMKHSNNYNPFHYLKDNDGNVNSNNVIKMINVFMLNTKEEGASGGDQFWTDATRLLLSSLCFLLVETVDEKDINFAGVLDLIHLAKVIEGKEEQKSDLDVIFDKRREEEPNALSVQYYDEFKQAAGKTMQSILISTTTKLQHFKLEDVRNLTHTDNIHLETMGDEKTALFIIIPSTDTTYNFLAAMMYTQLFDVLYDRAISYYHGRLPVHVRFLLDEFANCGKIPEFEKVLATCRKFEISAAVILQNLSQLKRLYEKSWEELPGNCDTMIYLGGKDQFTNEYLSKELGKETIDQQSINQTKGRQGSSSYNNAILGRELATIDELATMDNNDCIVMVRGLHPFMTPKFDITNHPRYDMLEEADKANNTFCLEENVFTEREIKEKKEETIDFSEFYGGDKKAESAEAIDVGFISGENGAFIPVSERADMPEELREISGIFAA